MLNKLKEYKEIIAIIVFFLSGFVWLESQFPKRSDLNSNISDVSSQIESLQCLVDKYMTLTQLQIRAQDLEKELERLTNAIATRFPNVSDEETVRLSPAMEFELEQLRRELEGKKHELKENQDEMVNIRSELERNVCGKVEL